MTRYKLIRLADNAIKCQLADGETLTDSPITYINDAEVRASLYDGDRDAVFSDLTLDYVTDSDGMYRGVLSSSGPESPSLEFDPPVGVDYELRIVVSTPSGANCTFPIPAEVANAKVANG